MSLRCWPAVLALALAAPAHASTVPQVVDATGDAVTMQASMDIVNARWYTTGTTKFRTVRGRAVRVYTPTKFLVTLKLAGPPVQAGPVVYIADAEVAGCGIARFYYAPGTVAATLLGPGMLYFECPEEDGTLLTDVPVTVKGNTLTWSAPVAELPKEVRVGAVFSDFRVGVYAQDPAIGVTGTILVPYGMAAIDYAVGPGLWRFG